MASHYTDVPPQPQPGEYAFSCLLSAASRELSPSFIIVSTRPGIPVSGAHRSALIAHHSWRELDHLIMPRLDIAP
jgi:hypothetical protein